MRRMFSNFVGADLLRMPSIARGEAGVVAAPLVAATDESLAGHGRIVRDLASARVTLVPWRSSRPWIARTL
jgi:hypothetical protein